MAVVVELPLTLPYRTCAYAETEAKARTALKEKTRGYYYVSTEIDIRQV